MAQRKGHSAIVPRGTVLPPPEPGVRYVRAPGLGIVIADDRLRQRVDRYFHTPMIVLALLVLPLFAFEFFFKQRLPPDLQAPATLFMLIAEATISFAFLVEFVVKISVAESRFEYVKRNWLDLVVILLPFLRAFRLLRAAKVARTSRVFRLRGVAMKLAKYGLTIFVGLKVTERILARFGIDLHARKRPEEMTRHQLMDEVKSLRKKVTAWERWHDAYQEYAEEHDVEPLPEKPELPDEPTPDEVQTEVEPPVQALDSAAAKGA